MADGEAPRRKTGPAAVMARLSPPTRLMWSGTRFARTSNRRTTQQTRAPQDWNRAEASWLNDNLRACFHVYGSPTTLRRMNVDTFTQSAGEDPIAPPGRAIEFDRSVASRTTDTMTPKADCGRGQVRRWVQRPDGTLAAAGALPPPRPPMCVAAASEPGPVPEHLTLGQLLDVLRHSIDPAVAEFGTSLAVQAERHSIDCEAQVCPPWRTPAASDVHRYVCRLAPKRHHPAFDAGIAAAHLASQGVPIHPSPAQWEQFALDYANNRFHNFRPMLHRIRELTPHFRIWSPTSSSHRRTTVPPLQSDHLRGPRVE